MSAITPSPRLPAAMDSRLRQVRLNRVDKRAERALKYLACFGALIVIAAIAAVIFQIIAGASLAISHFGPAFLTNKVWNTSSNQLGALSMIYGTLVTSLVSLVFATILGISIGLFLALMAPKSVANVIGPLVEMLAAIPSVVMGLIGIIVISPFSAKVLEPVFHDVLGFIPLFGAPQANGASLFTASLVLTIMVVPIISALTRDIFRTVPQELRDGAEALGATRWEMIRGVVLPTTVSGVVGACVLGLGRALGEAIAVVQVVGGGTFIHANMFLPGTTLTAVIVSEFESPANALTQSAFFYLALILLAMGVITNLISRTIIRRSMNV